MTTPRYAPPSPDPTPSEHARELVQELARAVDRTADVLCALAVFVGDHPDVRDVVERDVIEAGLAANLTEPPPAGRQRPLRRRRRRH